MREWRGQCFLVGCGVPIAVLQRKQRFWELKERPRNPTAVASVVILLDLHMEQTC